MTPQEELQALRKLKSKKELSPAEELKQLRSSRGLNKLGSPAIASFQDVIKSVSGEDTENFDYKTGAKGGLMAKLSLMETAEEKENFLLQRV